MIPADLVEAHTVFDRIRFEDEEVVAASRLHASQRQELNRQEADALAERARLAEADSRGTLVKETHGHDRAGNTTLERTRDDRRLKAADAQIESIRRRKKEMLGTVAQIPRLTGARIDLELAKFGNVNFVAVGRPSLPLGKNERAIDALPRFTAATLELTEERATDEKAARTLKEVEKAAHREIDRIADRGLPKTLRMFTGDAGIEWPIHEIQNPGFHKVPDGLALVAYLLRDKLKAEISALLKINANAFPNALSAEEKAARLAELDHEIDVASQIEAACVERIVAEGGTAHHRPDSSVLAVLSLRVAE
jgi:uncharacterized protein YaaQ